MGRAKREGLEDEWNGHEQAVSSEAGREKRERERKGCSNSRAVRLYLTVQTTRLDPQLQSRRFSVREIVCEP